VTHAAPRVAGTHGAMPNLLQTVWRTVARHWWRIAPLWIAISAGAVYLVYATVKPKYESVSLLRVEPTHRDLFGTNLHASEAFELFLETQVQLITSPNVLIAATSDPKVAALPFLQGVPDAEVEVRKHLNVGVVPKTYLIRVAMTSPSSAEAAVVVNAVVESYLETATEWSDGMTRTQIKNLEVYKVDLEGQLDELQKRWLALAAQGNLDVPSAPPSATGPATGAGTSESRITIDEFKRVRQELFRINVELIEAQADLSLWQAEAKAASADGRTEARLRSRLTAAFHALPEVARIREQISEAYRRAAKAERTARAASDPALIHAQRQIQALNARLQEHWETRKGELAERAANGGADDGDPVRAVRESTQRVESLKARRAGYEAMLATIDVANKQESSDAVKVALLREELAGVREMKDAVSKRLEQLRFESKADARISKVSEARVAGMPVSDGRKKLYLAVPLLALFGVFGVFVALELRSARVDDLDALAQLVAIDVHPIPTLPEPPTSAQGRLSRVRQQQVQDFVRSLEHLRVSLCDDDHEQGRPTGRCLLITSAVAGEGKTTLAGEFAISCARAGISTLVVDADLRRASMSRLVADVQGPGLGGALKGDVSPDEPVIFLEEGCFHLLPAGTPVADPGALLKGRRISQLLAHYRERFDLVILDSPPVLPVPDALTLGRWTDGVILVARHGFSRAPLVDRARRQIAATGIPILKTVVNGVRSSRQYGFGEYYGGYGDKAESDEGANDAVAHPLT